MKLINNHNPRERERESKSILPRLKSFLKKESQKPFFYSSLFFAILLLLVIFYKLVFSWNPPTTIAPNPAGQTLYSDSSNNIGIGTLYPGAKLEIYSTSSDSVLKLSRQSATSTLFKLGTDSALIINNNNSDVLTIKNGNVGIGMTEPSFGDSKVLQLTGTPRPVIRLTRPTGSEYIIGMEDANDKLYIVNSAGVSWPRDSMKGIIIDTAGNVGIGTDTGTSKLKVLGLIESTSGGFKFPDGTIQTSADFWDFQYVFPTITLGGVYSAAHGFGVKPSLWQVVIRCKSVNAGWAVNDEIILSTFGDQGVQHQTIGADATNIIAIIGVNNLSANNKSSGGGAALDPLAWELIMRAKR